MNKFFLALTLCGMTALQFIHANQTHALEYKSKFAVSNYAKTRYPLVFVHGFGLDFNRIGIDSIGLDYWYQIPQDLARNGGQRFLRLNCQPWLPMNFAVNSF